MAFVAIRGPPLPEETDFGSERSAMARMFPPLMASAKKTETMVPHDAVGEGKETGLAFDLVPLEAAGKFTSVFATAIRE